MSVLDGPMRALAQNLAGTFGVSGTLTREGGTYSTASRDLVNDFEDTYTITGVVEEMMQTEFGKQIGEGGEIRHGDLKFTIEAAGLDVDPDPETDTVTLDGITYAIVGTKPVYSGEQVALWTLVLRN